MKFNSSKRGGFSLAEILVIIAFISLLAAMVIPVIAQNSTGAATVGVQQPNFVVEDTTLFPLTLNNSTNTFAGGATNSYAKTIRQDKGLTIVVLVWQTNSVASTTTNLVLKFDDTADGTWWTRGVGSPAFSITVPLAASGVGTNQWTTNLPATFLSNVRKVQCTTAYCTASNNVFTRLFYSQSGQ